MKLTIFLTVGELLKATINIVTWRLNVELSVSSPKHVFPPKNCFPALFSYLLEILEASPLVYKENLKDFKSQFHPTT